MFWVNVDIFFIVGVYILDEKGIRVLFGYVYSICFICVLFGSVSLKVGGFYLDMVVDICGFIIIYDVGDYILCI